MKIEIEKKDYEKILFKMENSVEKFVNSKAKELIIDFSENIKLRKYLNRLIREMVREELKFIGLLKEENHDI